MNIKLCVQKVLRALEVLSGSLQKKAASFPQVFLFFFGCYKHLNLMTSEKLELWGVGGFILWVLSNLWTGFRRESDTGFWALELKGKEQRC